MIQYNFYLSYAELQCIKELVAEHEGWDCVTRLGLLEKLDNRIKSIDLEALNSETAREE